MKKLLKIIAHKTVLRPHYIRYCSQTIYESLLGCMRMWEATGEEKWKERADKVLSILLEIQQPDGGFDIGYEFNFGCLHRKGESTSPELVGLVALAQYSGLFGKERILLAARKAANWIRDRARDIGDGKFVIPYGPYSSNEVMVYNGVSFAAGALGCYLGLVENDDELRHIYQGMVRYLDSVMSTDRELPGRFWYYSDQIRTDLKERQRNKIDYYHQMQQVEIHSLAQQACGADDQLKIIISAADLIVALQDKYKVVPYTNSDIYVKERIHLWGYVSVASGMLEAAAVVPERKEVYYKVAEKVLNWMLKYGWNDEYFTAILTPQGETTEENQFFVRSNAWVFNTLACAAKHIGDGPWIDIADKCYMRMELADFSGPENHGSGRLARLVCSAYTLCWKMTHSAGKSV